jgi:hypothetical protein
VVCGLWFVVCGLWFVVCGLWFVVCGLWFVTDLAFYLLVASISSLSLLPTSFSQLPVFLTSRLLPPSCSQLPSLCIQNLPLNQEGLKKVIALLK